MFKQTRKVTFEKSLKAFFYDKWKIEIVSLVGISKSTMSPTFYIHMCMPLSLFSKQFQS